MPTHTRRTTYTAVVEVGESGSWSETGFLTLHAALAAAVSYAATTNQRVTDLYAELPDSGVVVHPSPEVLRRLRAETHQPCPVDEGQETWPEEQAEEESGILAASGATS